MEKLFPYWILGASLLDFVLMGMDKQQAKAGQRRVAEKWFFLIALLGGTPGAILGMYAFRHKTRHRHFKWGLPALLLLQLTLFWFWLEYGVELL